MSVAPLTPDRLGAAIALALGPGRVRAGEPLAPFTTFKVGGPADWFVDVMSAGELVEALALAAQAGVPVCVLGGGSNVLVTDRGVRGLVLRMRGAGITRAGDGAVRAQAGATVNGLVRWTVANGLTGLETWAGTPGTVGGAISGNAHFDGRSIGDRVLRAAVVSRAGVAAELVHDELAFGYDDSRLRHTGEILVWAEFRVESGNPVRLRDTARQSLHYRKRTQPLALPSAGCIFQNPDPARVQIPEGVPSSAGALIDRAGLKGARQGGALVSPTHANFIVNAGGATAADIRTLIERCRTAVRQQFGIELEEEIVCLGEF